MNKIIFILFFFIICVVFLGCVSSPLTRFSIEEQKRIIDIDIFENKVPESIEYVELGEVKGHNSRKDQMHIDLANLDMKCNAYKKYKNKVNAVIITQHSFYDGLYGETGTWSFGTAISIMSLHSE